MNFLKSFTFFFNALLSHNCYGGKLTVHLVNISYPELFKRYSRKYSIFRDLYENNLMGLEIRCIEPELSDKLRTFFLENKEICYHVPNESMNGNDFLALGSLNKFKSIAKEITAIDSENLGFRLSQVLHNVSDYEKKSFTVGGKTYNNNTAYIMGILNVTPDSFSDGGKYTKREDAVAHALNMLNEGADFIDIGGESTRPGSEIVSEEEELERVIPVVEAILAENSGAAISVDTTKAAVADEALSRGAVLVNDISGLTFDPNMSAVVKKHNASVVIMHIKGTPQNMQDNPHYDDVVAEVYGFLSQQIAKAKKEGITNIIADPGIGFGKRMIDNYEILKRLNEFKGLGCPILAGVSRKSFLGKTTGNDVNNRDNATIVAETSAIANGAKIIRTHNVKNAVEAKRIINCINNPKEVDKWSTSLR